MKLISLALVIVAFISCGNSNNPSQENSTEISTLNAMAEQSEEVIQEVEAIPKEELLAEVTEEQTIEDFKNETSNSKPETSNNKPQTENKPQPIIKETLTEKEIKVNDKPNHQIWDELTKKYVSTDGKVNYKGFKSELAQLKEYIDYLAKNPVKPTWSKKFIKSGDKTYSLNDIENIIVRPNFNEPLVHVAFNCAAVSCPILLNEAFIVDKLYSQLEKQAKKWVNDTTKNKLTPDKIKVSQIFDWYKDDFKSSGGVISFINKYSNTKVNEKAKISYLEYNWNLNE